MARTTLRTPRFLTLALVAGLLLALPATAEIYHVNLESGTSYESRYAPEEASWDSETLLIMTEAGNWIGVERATVTSVEVESELRGYGERIDATTVYMGRTPNSAPVEEELSPTERQNQLLETLINQGQNQPNYTMDQFVEPGDMGRNPNSGVPVGFTQQVTPPVGLAPQNPQ